MKKKLVIDMKLFGITIMSMEETREIIEDDSKK